MMLKKTLATIGTAGLLTAGTVGVAAPAQARPLIAGGLVNIQVTEVQIIDDVAVDVLVQDVNIGINAALALAANVCDTTIAVIAQDLRDGSAECTSTVDGATATLTQR